MVEKTTLNCYLCQEDFKVDYAFLYTYLLVKKDINICDYSCSNCEGMLNKKYGKNPKRTKDNPFAPDSLWFEKKNFLRFFHLKKSE